MITLKRIRSQFTPWPEDLPNDPEFYRQLNGIAYSLRYLPGVQPHKTRSRKARQIIKTAEKLRQQMGHFYGESWHVTDHGQLSPHGGFTAGDAVLEVCASIEFPPPPAGLHDLLCCGVPAYQILHIPAADYPCTIMDATAPLPLRRTHFPNVCEAELLKLVLAMEYYAKGEGQSGRLPAIRERMACDKVADLFQIYQIPVTFHVESLFVATCACVLERGEKPGETATEREAIAGRAATQATTHCRRIVSERRAKQAP